MIYNDINYNTKYLYKNTIYIFTITYEGVSIVNCSMTKLL